MPAPLAFEARTVCSRTAEELPMAGFFKSLLAIDRTLRVFCTGRLVHPVTIQMFGLAGGFDGFWLDQEHAGVSIDRITLAALAGRASGFGCFVRMPMTGYAAVTQSLESGVDGVMAAQVASAAEADQFVRWARFSPRGVRGVNTQGADGHFTHKPASELAQTPTAIISWPSKSKPWVPWTRLTRSPKPTAWICSSSGRRTWPSRWACWAS